MSDRTLGYVIIIAFILFFLFPAIYLFSTQLAPQHRRTVFFEEANTLSFLKLQDPVRVRGVEAGQVAAIYWRDGKTLVIIETHTPLSLHEGYRVIADTKGMMGDRYVEIDPGPADRPLVSDKDTLRGTFPLGPTEVIAYTEQMRTAVRMLIRLTDSMQSEETFSFVGRWQDVCGRLDTVSRELVNTLRAAQRKGNAALSAASSLSEDVDALTRRLATSVPATASSVDTIISKAEHVLLLADTLIIASNALMEKTTGPEAQKLFVKLLEFRERLTKLKELIAVARDEGLWLPVRLR